VQLTPNTAAFSTICSSAQLAANACPPGSKVGTTQATSPFVAAPLTGPVYIAQQSGSVLPSLVADLFGRVHVRITIANSILGGKQVRATVTNAPDLPIASFSLALNGGAKGVVLAKSDLCFTSDSQSKFRTLKTGVTFRGHNGTTLDSSPRIEIEGCAPRLEAALRHARRPRPTLKFLVQRHPDAEKLTRLELTLPKGLALVKRALKRRASGKASGALSRSAFTAKGKRRLVVTLPSNGADTASVKLGRGVLKEKRSLQRKLGRRRKAKVKFKLVSVDTAHQQLTTRATGSAKR
jgi:hypothetical protein